MFYCCGITDKGCSLSHNEDAYLINKIVMTKAAMESSLKEPFIIGVADGVAGENSGEIASKLCLEHLSNIKFSKNTNIKQKIHNIHENLRRYGISHDNALNMQTTLCAFAADEDGNAYSVNIGDSRMYLFHCGVLSQLTKDQSLVELLCDAGEITKEEKVGHAQKHIIFPVLGNVSSCPAADIKNIGFISESDIILICTDGLSDYAEPEEICSILSQNIKLSKRLELLVSKAIEKGSKDNITVLAVSKNEI